MQVETAAAGIAESPTGAVKSTPAQGPGMIAIGCAVNLLFAMYLSALGVVLPFIGASFHIGDAVRGRLFPANCLGATVSLLLCGYLSDRLGRRIVLLASIGMYALGLALFGMASTFGFALLAAPLIGGGCSVMQTISNAILSDLYADRRAVVINAMQVAFGVGAVVGPFAARFLLVSHVAWRHLYFGLFGIDLVLLAAAFALPLPNVRTASLDMAAIRKLMRRPAFGGLCLAAALYAGAEVGFFSWLPTYFNLLPGGRRWIGIIVSVFWGGMTLGRGALGFLLGRGDLRRLRRGLAALGGAWALLALSSRSPLVVMAFVLLTGLSFGGIFSLIMAEGGARFPRTVGTVFGAIVAASNVGSALVPWAIGVVSATALGWRGALGLVPLCAFAVVGLSLLPPKPESGSSDSY